VATEGGDSPAVDAPGGPERSQASDADVVITTVVSSDDPRPSALPPRAEPADDLEWGWEGDDDEDPLRPPARAADSAPAAAVPGGDEAAAPAGSPARDRSSLEERVAALEAVPVTLDTLGKAIRHELERCSGVLFSHDRALGALGTRLDAVEAAGTGDPATDVLAERARIAEAAVARVLEQVDRMDQRILAMETRVEPLEPLPTVVQALRRAVRASDELIAGETAAREQALVALAGQQATDAQSRDDALRGLVAQDLDRVSGVSAAQAKGLADLAERLAAVEARLAPLASAPEDIAALSRILRREIDAIVSDNQARDQMLRRALQNEIDQLMATSEAREVLAQGLAARLESLETRSAEVASELEQLRAGSQAHDQLAGELTRRLSALDTRLARLDPLPGEVQSLRTAILQEAERTVASLRAADERIGELAWVPGEFQEARKRIMALSSGVQTGQDRIRQLEGTIASLSERLESVRARLSATTPPGSAG
jgi:DNA repair exonuclease SbcCD ATPase subunit